MIKLENKEAALESLPETRERLLGEIRKGIIGQDDVIEQLLITLLARGHC
jgi:MoxR-like ATPase